MTIASTAPRRMLLAGAVVVAACAVLPSDTASLLVELVGIAGMVALVRGARRNGSRDLAVFQLIAAGGSSFLLGNLVRAVHGMVSGVTSPFPSPADVFYYIGYCLLLAGFMQLVRRRSAQIEGDNLLDAALMATCIGIFAVVFVVLPVLHEGTGGALGQAMTVLYTIFDVVLLSTVVRLAVGSGRRSPSYYLLLASSTCVALTDIFITITIAGSANGAADAGIASRLVLMASPLCYVLAGAAGLHPSIARLTDRPDLRDIHLSPRRLAVLFSAVLGMLGLLLASLLFSGRGQIAVAAGGAVAAILIVLGRLALLVQANERKADREATLRDAAGALAHASSVHAMYDIAANVLADLLGSSSTWVVVANGGSVEVAATGEGTALTAVATTQALDRAVAAVGAGDDACMVDASALAGEARLVLAAPVEVRRGPAAILVAATDAPVTRQLVHAMGTIAIQLAGAIDGLLLAEEVYRREQEQRFRALVEHSSDLVTVLDEDGLVTFASPACMQLLGLPEGQIVGRHPFERVHAEDRFDAVSLLDRSWAVAGVMDPIEVRFQHLSGEWRWFEILVENLLEQSEVGAVIIHSRDVTDRRRAQEELSAREARFRSLVQHNADLIAIVDDQLQLTYVSPAARSMLGYEPDSLVGRSITEIIPADQLFIENEMLPSMAEAQVRDATGQWRAVELTITDLRNDPAVAGIVVNARDVSERKTLESKLRHLAMHDPLTGLANRNLLHDRLGAALTHIDRSVAVLYLDIDDFKALNDSLGHGYGDTALCEVARRLNAGIRDSDLAARLGGDEFAVLLEGSGAGTPMEVAERLLEAVRPCARPTPPSRR